MNSLSFADSHKINSLLSYTGYLTTPSAYITDSQVNISYSYFSNSFPINEYVSGKNSEIWIFSSSIGFFPFLECFFSLYVAPSKNISDVIPNYGADKWRTAGIKLKLLSERTILPSIAAGVNDPDIGSLNNSSQSNVTASYIVLSKQFFTENISMSLGYGFDYFVKNTDTASLQDVFGGCSFKINDNVVLLCDYDNKYWNGGFSLRWKEVDIGFSYKEGNFLASRIGYGVNLLKH